MREPGRSISRDIARGEAVEHELVAFVSRQHDRRVVDEGERPAEASWMESERRHDVGRREAMRAAWALSITGARQGGTGPSWSP